MLGNRNDLSKGKGGVPPIGKCPKFDQIQLQKQTTQTNTYNTPGAV